MSGENNIGEKTRVEVDFFCFSIFFFYIFISNIFNYIS